MAYQRRPRTHLPRQDRGPVSQAACSVRDPRKWSRTLREVDCEECLRSPLMADAEVKQQLNRSNQIAFRSTERQKGMVSHDRINT